MRYLIMLLAILMMNTRIQAATFTVNTTADADVCDAVTCTLRGAINAALAVGGADVIEFDIPADALNENYFSGGSGQTAFQYWSIQPTSELPALLDITIDGTSAGSSVAGNPTIVLDGSLAGDINPGAWDTLDGLTLLENSEVTGLAIINWFNAGIRMGYLDTDDPAGFNNTVTASWLGLNVPYGQASAPNKYGITISTNDGSNNIIGGNMDTAGNVISGNLQYGVQFEYWISGGAVALLGNKIGTDPSGLIAVPNDVTGVTIWSQAQANIIIGFDFPGLGNLISGNNLTGVLVVPTDEENLISISGNLIGTDITGMSALPNREGVVLSYGRQMTVEGNVISGNSGVGLTVSTSSPSPLRRVQVISNLIGVAADGQTPLPNLGGGVYSSGIAIDTVIGKPGEGNVIAYNQCGPNWGCGIAVSGFTNNVIEIRHNSIYNNENEGIDLESDRFTPNDAGDFDSGANRLQNFPDINSAQHDPDGNRINLNFWVDSHNGASDYPITLDVYAADSDGQEGQTWLASTTFTESQYLAGNPITRTMTAAAAVAENDVIVVTATEGGGRTSEFSPGFVLAGQPDFSIACPNTRITTSPSLSCTVGCEAEAVNGWADEVGLSCTHPDSSCLFVPSDEITWTQAVMPFDVDIMHTAATPGVYLNEVVGSFDAQGGTITRQEVITIEQLTDEDYLFVDGFDGVICQ
ncbi:CSLREA domain-containing protein [Marinicella sediminis]|uniref:CSLREA domain-containing protein n=1 Tax=Marinicella sediminis TaxID=1792834 RepID=A0ABV7J995_9GAMM|nr:CSLREA domain-containing protein [Marinicella sediminis]